MTPGDVAQYYIFLRFRYRIIGSLLLRPVSFRDLLPVSGIWRTDERQQPHSAPRHDDNRKQHLARRSKGGKTTGPSTQINTSGIRRTFWTKHREQPTPSTIKDDQHLWTPRNHGNHGTLVWMTPALDPATTTAPRSGGSLCSQRAHRMSLLQIQTPRQAPPESTTHLPSAWALQATGSGCQRLHQRTDGELFGWCAEVLGGTAGPKEDGHSNCQEYKREVVRSFQFLYSEVFWSTLIQNLKTFRC